ncbi:peptide chain release factor family protein [Psychrobacter aquaticus]|nr:hypothetical protein [Psychrobacter aquaticus]
MPNAYIEIYTENQSETCLKWVGGMVKILMGFYENTRGLEWSGVYSESYQGKGYTFVHLSALLKHSESDAYQLLFDFLQEECQTLIKDRPDDCHILLTPQSPIDYKDGLGLRNSQITQKFIQFPNVGVITSRFAGYRRIEVIMAHRKTGFSVIANDHRSQIANTEIAGQYLYSRIQFYKYLPKDAIWY